MPKTIIAWTWEDAFQNYGFNDGNDWCRTFVVVEALEELGYKCETSYGSHNNYICTLTKDTTSIEVGEDNLRRSLPRDAVTFLDQQFGETYIIEYP